MAIGDTYKIVIEWTNNPLAPRFVNAFYFQQAGSEVADTPEEDLYARFMAEVGDAYRDCITNQLAAVRISVSQAPEFLTAFVSEGSSLLAGTRSGDPMPARICGIIKYRTPDLSRRGRGRVFLPPPSEAENSLGAPTGTYNTIQEGLLEALYGMSTVDAGYAEWVWALWSEADQTSKIITNYSPGGYWGTRRKRKAIYS